MAECDVIQIIEPDPTLPVEVGPATPDPALSERGEVTLAINQSEVSVTFQTLKLNANYRFEYLYVDAFGVINPGTINPVPISQTTAGFVVDLAGAPPQTGYILRWHVAVVSTLGSIVVDAPENLRVQLPHIDIESFTSTLEVFFVNPRSNTSYGFIELRVENLVDDPDDQSPIAIQVYFKGLTSFKIAMNPTPPTANYFLVARTP